MLKYTKNFADWWNRPEKSVLMDYVQSFIIILPIAFIIRTWGYGLYQVPSGSMETTMLVGELFFADKFTYTFIRKPQRGDIISLNQPEASGYMYSKNRWVRLFQYYVYGPENWTKRVIGIPGDHVQGKIEEGKTVVYLNGEKLDEPYVNNYPLLMQSIENHLTKSFDPEYSYENQPFYCMQPYVIKKVEEFWKARGIAPRREPGTPLDFYPDLKNNYGSDAFDIHLGENQYWGMGDNRLGSFDCRGWGPIDGNLIHGRIVFRIFSLDKDSNSSGVFIDILKHPFTVWKRIRWRRCLNILK